MRGDRLHRTQVHTDAAAWHAGEAVLSDERIPQYLLERGLIGPEAIVESDLVVRDVSRRNRNLIVKRALGRSYFLKQAQDSTLREAVAHEATMLETLRPLDVTFAKHLPRLVDYDPSENLLVVELLVGSRDLMTHHQMLERLPPELGMAVGQALGALHHITARGPSGPPSSMPPCLSMERPRSAGLRDLSAATLELIRIVQGAPELRNGMTALRTSWQAETIVHGDIRWSNVLVTAPGNATAAHVRASQTAPIVLVDWEMSGRGDPSWDLGSAMAEYVSFWLSSIPAVGVQSPEKLAALARHPLGGMESAILAFWHAYAAQRELGGMEGVRLLRRAMPMVAARLLTAALEISQTMDRLTTHVIHHVQVAANIFADPTGAASLLGLSGELLPSAA